MPEPKAPQPKPAQSDDDEADEVDTTPEEIDEAVEEVEEAESAEPGAYFSGEEQVEEIDLDLAETDIGEEVSDTPDDTGGENGRGAFDSVSDSDKSFERERSQPAEAAAQMESTVADNINAGAARLSVVGLPDEFNHHGETQTKDDLREEFEEVFDTFKLGAYGEEVAEEYLFVDVEDVDPLTGFTVSMIACTTIVMMSRPDSDELLNKVKNTAQR